MSGLELIEALRMTGTGESKLRVAQRVVDAKPDATGDDVLEALLREPKVVGAATVMKAQKLMKGASVKDFQGTPPRNAEESKLRTLGREIGEAIVGQIADAQARAQADRVGVPDLTRKGK